MHSARPALPAGLGGQRAAIGRRDCGKRDKCDATRCGRPDVTGPSGGRWIVDDHNHHRRAAGRSAVRAAVIAGWVRNHNDDDPRCPAAGRSAADHHPTRCRTADHGPTPCRTSAHDCHHDPTAAPVSTHHDHRHDDNHDHHDDRHPAVWVYFPRRVLGGAVQRVLRRIHGEHTGVGISRKRAGVRISGKRGGAWIGGRGGHLKRRGVISRFRDRRSKRRLRGQPQHFLGRPKCGSRRQRVRWVGTAADTGRIRGTYAQPARDEQLGGFNRGCRHARPR